MVAELPTCQKMLAALAPPASITWRPDVVVSVEAIWKIQTAFELPPASRVRSPDDMASEEVDLYSPGASVNPPMFPDTVMGATVLPAASLKAVVKSASACAATGPPANTVPLIVTAGVPATRAAPGNIPMFPVTVPPPVKVTVVPATTAKVESDPRLTAAC